MTRAYYVVPHIWRREPPHLPSLERRRHPCWALPEPSRGGDVPCDVPFVLRMAHHRSPKSQLLPGSSYTSTHPAHAPQRAVKFRSDCFPASFPRFQIPAPARLVVHGPRVKIPVFLSPPHPSVGECAPPAFANSRPGQHRRERRDDRSDKRRADRARRRDYDEAAFPESGVDVPARRKRCSARGARREERETSERARTKVSQSNPRYRTRPCTHTSTYRSRTAGSPPPWQPGCR